MYASNFLLHQTKHFHMLFPLSLQAKRQRGPPNCHCITAVPAERGRNTEVVDKEFKAHNTKGLSVALTVL